LGLRGWRLGCRVVVLIGKFDSLLVAERDWDGMVC
jgi:hypothetical protein